MSYVDIGAGIAIAAWMGLVLLFGWVALVAGWLKRRFRWRMLPREKWSFRAATVSALLVLAAMGGLIYITTGRGQPLPLQKTEDLLMFGFWLGAPFTCLVLAVWFSCRPLPLHK